MVDITGWRSICPDGGQAGSGWWTLLKNNHLTNILSVKPFTFALLNMPEQSSLGKVLRFTGSDVFLLFQLQLQQWFLCNKYERKCVVSMSNNNQGWEDKEESRGPPAKNNLSRTFFCFIFCHWAEMDKCPHTTHLSLRQSAASHLALHFHLIT